MCTVVTSSPPSRDKFCALVEKHVAHTYVDISERVEASGSRNSGQLEWSQRPEKFVGDVDVQGISA
jgi:hypothetical protein